MSIKRTPREWIEPCTMCGGTGQRHRKEFFSLWTPDEHDARPLPDAPAGAYVCTAVPGGTIQEACREAAEIALLVSRDVAFKFNGTIVIVHPGEDPEIAFNRWSSRGGL